jgi:hypothetical protein
VGGSLGQNVMNFDDSAPLPPPAPLTSTRVAAIVAVYVVAIGFGIALFTGNIPGLSGHYSSEVELNGHEYYFLPYLIPLPQLGNNSTSPNEIAFQGVTFWTWLTGWGSSQGGYVHGNGTEANGTSYPFVLGGLLSSPDRTTLYISPDSKFAVGWSGEFVLELMVET